MNALNMAKTAYSSQQTAVRTPRGIEFDTFARITHRLKSAAADRNTGFARLATAIHENRKLWTILATDVAETDNGLPQDLRARIFYLAEFTQQHSRKVLSDGADAEVLVDINTAVMRGLRQTVDAA